MDSSPLPSRTRPKQLKLSFQRNPFSLAKLASSQRSSQRKKPQVENIEDSENDEDEDDDDDDEDELAGGSSNSPYFTQPTQAVMQPTQLVKRPTAGPPTGQKAVSILSSSPTRSVVEVPASSPFQSPKTGPQPLARGRLASMMAPAGTAFRSPVPAPRQSPVKLPQRKSKDQRSRSPENDDDDDDDDELAAVIRIDDSSEEDNNHSPTRGNIRPASFRRPSPPPPVRPVEPSREQAASTNNRKTLNDRKVDHLLGKVLVQLRNKGYSSVDRDECRTALLDSNYSVQEAVNSVIDAHLESSPPPPPPVKQSKNKVSGMFQSFAYQASQESTSRASSPGASSSQQSLKRRTLSPAPQPKRRRLVQGRKYKDVSSSQTNSPMKKTAKTTKLVDLTADSDDNMEETQESRESEEEDNLADEDVSQAIVVEDGDDDDDDDGVDNYENDSDAEMDDFDVEKRVLKYLNTCTVDDLVAMLGGKARVKATTVLDQRPFRSKAAVVRIQSQTKSKKKSKDTIGEDIFDAVEEYVIGLQAIDVVVGQCEQKALQLRTKLHKWDVDSMGSSKSKAAAASMETTTGEGEGGKDGMLTPSSDAGRRNNNGYEPLPIPQEPEMMRDHCTMKSYQLFGLNWLWELYQRRFGCILADDMGLGKTCQVISLFSHMIESYEGPLDDEEQRPWPNLVVVPPSTLSNWQAEFQKFAPDLQVTVYRGSPQERSEIMYEVQETREDHHVVLTSYSQVKNAADVDNMRRLSPNAAVFDEGHMMKNSNTNQYKFLSRIRSNWRLILSGTPVQNNLMEMINLLNFIQPTLFHRHLDKLGVIFSQRYSLRDVSNGALLFTDRVRRARTILEPFILQRRKEQVLHNLPTKTSRVVYCDLDETQKKIYDAYERQFREGKGASTGTGSRVPAAINGQASDQNNVWMQLRKASIHAQLFRRQFDDKKVEKMAQILMRTVPEKELRQTNMQHLIGELQGLSDFELHTWCRDYKCIRRFDVEDGSWLRSGKVRALLELLEQFRANGDRTLVFTRFARVLNILRECLDHMGIGYESLEGATRVEDRQMHIDTFNQDPDVAVFLLTTGSGGTGINLTAANKVIILDQSDNPQDDVQAENRAHRMGQTRDVEVIKLVTRGTIEELVYKACQTKLELAQRVTAGSRSGGMGGFDSGAVAEVSDSTMDETKAAKAMEDQVRKMLLEGATATPPESD